MKYELIKKAVIRTLALAVLVLAGGIFLSSPANALTVSPPTAEFLLEPGVSRTSTIKLYNETQTNKTYYIEVANFGAEGETGVPAFDFEAEKIGFATWISLPVETVELAPGETQEIAVNIDTPATASPGGHYAAVFFSEEPPEEGGEVAIGSKIGTLYLARVDGQVIEQGSIIEVSTSKDSYNRLPVEFAIRFQNTGNTHLRPSGTLEVTNLFGKQTAILDVNPTKGATLPGQIRKYEALWQKDVVDEKGSGAWAAFWDEYRNEKQNFAFGKYTATASLISGTSNALAHTGSVSFWVFPWHVILVYALVVIIIVLVLVFGIGQYNKWILSKAGKYKADHLTKPEKTTHKKKEK